MLDLLQQMSDKGLIFMHDLIYVCIILTDADTRSILLLIARCFVTHLVPIQEFLVNFSSFSSLCVCVFSY